VGDILRSNLKNPKVGPRPHPISFFINQCDNRVVDSFSAVSWSASGGQTSQQATF